MFFPSLKKLSLPDEYIVSLYYPFDVPIGPAEEKPSP